MKKTIRIIGYSLLGIIILALLGSYIGYATFRAKDPEMETDPSALSYYHETYEECREAFLQNVKELSGEFDSVITGKIMVVSEVDEDLSIDWCYLPAQQEKEKLLIVNSGLHGIEGYTGSAIQNMFMEEILPKEYATNTGILLLHGLNPYGFKYHRKVTENNVDLNRNCVQGDQGFGIENQGFVELTDLLMPTEPANVASLHNQFFYLVAIYKIIRESMPVLRQAALQGQYEFDKGFYYGGTGYEPQIDSLRPLLTGVIEQYRTVLTLDLHTAYGERGRLHLFIDKPEDPEVLKGVEDIFKGVQIDWGSSDDFYTINGEYIGWVNQLVPDVLCIPMLFEFGTLNSQKTFGSLKSIQIMILENQGAHYGFRNERNESKVHRLFDEMYYPASPVWRTKVIDDSRRMMGMMMENFEGFETE